MILKAGSTTACGRLSAIRPPGTLTWPVALALSQPHQIFAMIITKDSVITALSQHIGLVSVINAAHITVEKITVANAILRFQLRNCEVNARDGKIKWMRELPPAPRITGEIPSDRFYSGFRQDWGPALQPGWCDDHGGPK